MKNYNQLIWELSDEAEQDPYSVYDKILEEFHKTESELKEQLDSEMPISRDLMDLQKKLNKLLARSAPFLIGEYNFMKQYDKERANQ
ncbi:MAG: hypothetical protein IPJ45_09155 [Ignavibacteria bacterium]|nr:hypothetical protein [Ignavibacteria bacterium]